MKLTGECGCVVELPVNYVLHFIKGVEYKKPELISVCKVHQYEILLRHIKAHGAITLSQIKNTLKISEEEAMILMRQVKEKNKEVLVIFNDFTLTWIE